MPLAVRAVLFWIVLFGLAIINGALREFVLRPVVGLSALPLSSLTLIALHALAIVLFLRGNPTITLRQACVIGLAWLLLTLFAEVYLTALSGRPIRDVAEALSWDSFSTGNWMVLVYLFVLTAPALFVRMRH